MIIYDLDIGGPRVRPLETESPLSVDPDAPLTGPVPAKGFETIARRRAQIVERPGGGEVSELAAATASNARHRAGQFESLKKRSVSRSLKLRIMPVVWHTDCVSSRD